MAPCQEEYAAMQDALDRHGIESRQYQDAQEEYHACMRRHGVIAAGRSAHGAAWDEKLWLLSLELQAAWEKLFGKLKLPFPPPCGPRSIEVRTEILSSKSTAMLFSKKIDEAFREAGVKLDDGETFACSVCVVKKPQYVSEALALDPLGLSLDGGPRLNYVLEPTIMGSALDAIEQDTIDYGAKTGK